MAHVSDDLDQNTMMSRGFTPEEEDLMDEQSADPGGEGAGASNEISAFESTTKPSLGTSAGDKKKSRKRTKPSKS